MERRYSVSEINRMRLALLGANTPGNFYWAGQLTNVDLEARALRHALLVEAMLQTHMMNGTEPDELEAALTAEQPG